MCCKEPDYHIDVTNFTNDTHDCHSNLSEIYGYNVWSTAPNQVGPLIPDSNVILPSNASEPMDFASIPSLDQNFVELDHVIAFDDGSMFTTSHCDVQCLHEKNNN